MLKKIDVVEKMIKVFDTSNMRIGDAYIMTIGNDALEIFDDVLTPEQEVFILIESFTENEIRAVYIPYMTAEKRAQRFIITPDMDVTLERIML